MIQAAIEQLLPALVVGALLTVRGLAFRAARRLDDFGPLADRSQSPAYSPRAELLPAPMMAIGVWYLVTGLACLALAEGEHAFSPWAMGLPFEGGTIACRTAHSFSKDERCDRLSPNRAKAALPTKGSTASSMRKRGSSVLTSLVTHPKGLLFGDLKQLCNVTDGNLSQHLQVLEEAGLVRNRQKLRKQPPSNAVQDHGRRPQTLLQYLDVLEQVVRDAAVPSTEAPPASAGGRLLRGEMKTIFLSINFVMQSYF